MVLCEMHHARQSPRPVLIKSLKKASFIGRISQYFPFREVCDWSVLTKLSLRTRYGVSAYSKSWFEFIVLRPLPLPKRTWYIPDYDCSSIEKLQIFKHSPPTALWEKIGAY